MDQAGNLREARAASSGSFTDRRCPRTQAVNPSPLGRGFRTGGVND